MKNKVRSQFLSQIVPPFMICIILLVFIIYFPSQAAPVGNLVVNSIADTDDGICGSGHCTLREAINAANAAVGTDVIAFSLLPSATITLNGNQLPLISDTLTIDGSTVQNLTISGNYMSRVFQVDNNVAVTLTNLTISGGQVDCNNCSSAHGAGIYNDGGKVIVRNSTFKSNYVMNYGGAIYNNGGELIIDDSIFWGNFSFGAGGGIANNVTGTLSVNNSSFISNFISSVVPVVPPTGGAAISNEGRAEIYSSIFNDNQATSSKGTRGGAILNSGYLTASNTIFTNNFAAGSGGAVYNNGFLVIIGSDISNNSVVGSWGGGVGGGILNWGSATILNSMVRSNSVTRMPSFPVVFDNSGGGIANFGLLNLIYSTVSDNSVIGLTDDIVKGGGIANNEFGLLTITNSTISGNSLLGLEGGLSNGGGLYNSTVLTLTNSTVSNNSAVVNGIGVPSGGGLNNSGTLHFSNTIIANSPDGGDCVNGGVIDTNIANLVEDGSCSPALSGDPMLGPLQGNGGQTSTHLPLPGSPAIDNGANDVCEKKDQRGIPRPIDGDDNGKAVCDIGSVELGGRFMLMPIVLND